MSRFSRRTFIAAGTAGAAGLASGLWWWRRPGDEHADHAAHVAPPFTPDAGFPNPLRLPGSDGMYGVLDVAGPFTIVAKPVQHAFLPGKPAAMLAFEVEQHGQTFFNPLLRVRSGTVFRAKFWNALDETSIIHWHGLKVDSNNDGHPHYAIPGGATYDYQFTVANRAGTYWYHPHPHHLTGKQVYLGLTGLFIVEDDDEVRLQQALDLKLGATDIPLVLQDRHLDGDGRISFTPSAEERFDGYRGSQVLVNATPGPYLDTETRIYRFRILNGSNARMYRLAFRHGERLIDFQVIGTDGGLLDRPYPAKEAFLAPAERVEILLDLRAARPGDTVTLTTLEFDPMEHEEEGDAAAAAHSGHGAHAQAASAGATEAAEGAPLDLLRIHVRRRSPYDRAVPQTLAKLDAPADPKTKPRVITLDVFKSRWRINGMTYDLRATPIVVKRGAVEVWEIRNAARSMPHPMHIHGFQSRVLSREGSPEQQQRLAVAENGLAATDLGWKDTMLVWPGETVRIVTDFSHPFLGDQVYMVHCHNLEHEDGGMMLNLKVAG